MNKINKLRDYLLENYVDRYGNLDISGLDFSDFDGDIIVNGMKVKGGLYQVSHEVTGDLIQSWYEVKGDLHQGWHEVKGNYYSTNINVNGKIIFEEPKKALKEITVEELEKMGYKIKEERK